MKARLLFLLPLLVTTTLAGDMQKYLSETKARIRQKMYPEALERLVWFYDNVLQHDPAMAGVRNSFALGYWKDLGEVYPPASKAFLALREEKAQLIRSGKGSPQTVKDLAAIEAILRE